MRREEIDFSEHNISWIKASGNCYIDLGNLNTSGTASIDTEFKFKCGEKQSSTTAVTDSLIMSPPNHGVQIYSAHYTESGYNEYRIYNQSAYQTILPETEVVVNTSTTRTQRTVTVNGSTFIQNFTRSITDNNLILFASPYYGYYNNRDSLAYLKIWRNGTLVRDLFPVLSGSEVCMYDNVNNVLYHNQGTGNFIGE